MGIFRRNPEKMYGMNIPCDYKLNVKATNINKNWIICILIIIVVILSAIICSSALFNPNNVAMIISFTATILSIVLSLLAIIYSYIGNIDTSHNLSEIRSAVSEIRATEDAIKSFMSSINNNVSNVVGGKISNQINSDSLPDVNTINYSQQQPVAGTPIVTNNLQEGNVTQV